MTTRPSFQFYPADWRNKTALRRCSIGARGLWIDMLCIMHTGEPYGHLATDGEAIGPEELARIVGERLKDVTRWLAELSARNIFSVSDGGILFSRRMVKDESERGQWRGRQERSRACHADVTDGVTANVTPKSRRSSSSSSSSEKKEPNGSSSAGADLPAMAVEIYEQETRSLKWARIKKLTRSRRASLSQRLIDCSGLDGWRAAMKRAVASDFLSGRIERSNGHANWNPDLDFFLQQKTFLHLLEGKYDNRSGEPTNQTSWAAEVAALEHESGVKC